MFVYEKKLQYPVNIKQTNAKLAKIIITQYGGAYSKTYKKQAVRYKSATACCFDINYGSIINVGVTNRSYKNNFKKSRAYLSKIR